MTTSATLEEALAGAIAVAPRHLSGHAALHFLQADLTSARSLVATFMLPGLPPGERGSL